MKHLALRFAPIALACLAAIAMPVPAANAQFSMRDPAAQSVMSSRDFNALLVELSFDDGQAATVGALFDDMQLELIAARDELAAGQAPAPNADARALAEHESRRRRAHQRMSAAEQAFFDGLRALARPEQQAAVEREHLAAQRRLVRRTLSPGQSSAGPVRVDFIAAIQESGLTDAEKARAYAALTSYQAQLTALLQQALKDGLDIGSKAARLREHAAPSPAPSVQGTGMIELADVAGDPARREASVPFDDTVDKIAALHLQAMVTLEGALGAAPADALAAPAARRVWPRAATDPRSPRAAFAQIQREIDRGVRPAEQRAALDAAHPAWLGAWWAATRKACDADNGLRRYGLLAMGGDDARELRRALRDAHAQRDEANRAAWRALAAIDTQHADFYAPLIAQAAADSMAVFSGPQGPTPPSLEPAAATGSEVRASFAATMIMVSRSSDDGEGDEAMPPMPIIMEAAGDGPISISIGPDGIANFISDTVGDGMGTHDFMRVTDDAGESALQLSGARMPAPMTRDHALAIATAAAGGPPSPAVFDQVYRDYSERAQEVDSTAGAAARELLAGSLPGVTTQVINDNGDMEESRETVRTVADLRAGAARLDVYISQLGAVDDAFLAGLVAACHPGATPAQVATLCEERARQRLAQLRYPAPMFRLHAPDSTHHPVDLAAVVRLAALNAADRATAEEIIAAWSPTALGAMEQARSTLRAVSLDLLELEHTAAAAPATPAQPARPRGAPGTVERRMGVRMEDGAAQAHRQLADRARAASAPQAALVRSARAELEARLSPEGKAAVLGAWCRLVAPQAFEDRRNASALLDAARVLPDLTPEQARRIDALEASHSAEHARVTERIGMCAAEAATPGDHPPPTDELARLRFDRSELNERTLRRLRTTLTPAQNAALPALGSAARGGRADTAVQP